MADQPKTQMPKPTKRPRTCHIKNSQEGPVAVSKLKYEAAAAKPPYKPYPSLGLLTLQIRAIEEDNTQRKRRGVKKE